MANAGLLLFLTLLLTCGGVKCCEYAHTTDWNITYTESEYIFNAPLEKLNSINKLQTIKSAYILTMNNNNIPTLCSGTIANFPNLVLLELINSNIENIEAGAFKNMSVNAVLHLDRNKLTAVRTGVFAGLEIASLYLDDNQISLIEADAFDNMPNLELLSLTMNSITKWNSEWFKGTPHLTYLYFGENKISQIPEYALKHIAEFTTNSSVLSLENNRINDIHPEAFRGVKHFGKIILHGNKLKDLPDNLLDNIESVILLDLRRNKLGCLSDEMLTSVKNVKIVKLQNNPLENSCENRVQQVKEKENINVYLHDPVLL